MQISSSGWPNSAIRKAGILTSITSKQRVLISVSYSCAGRRTVTGLFVSCSRGNEAGCNQSPGIWPHKCSTMLCIRHPPGAYARGEFSYLAAYFFPAFGVAASCEEIGELVVSAVLAETLKKIAAIETAKNFIVGS
jgi:hypothetical protein